MSPEFLYLHVMAWEKHQKDRTYVWFKLRNDIFADPKFFSLSLKAKIVFIYILSACARAGTATVQLQYQLIARSVPMRVNFVLAAINELEEIQMVKRVSCTDDVHRREEKEEKEEKDKKAARNPRIVSESLNNVEGKERPKSNAEILYDLWNQHRGKLPKAQKLTPSRIKKAEKRMIEEPSLENWVQVITALARSDFYCGKNKGEWKANFDYLIKPDTFMKVLEGISERPVKSGLVDDL